MQSCIYHGRVQHTRSAPRRHEFGYRLFMMYLDLDELDEVFAGRWLWSVEKRNLASWQRRDFLGSKERPLKEAVLDRVESELGRRPTGAVRMLTHLRYFGLSFNPVTFYYCFDAETEELDCVVAEITNTPWNERHAYVLDAQDGSMQWDFDKSFHVSPFFPMQQRYRWVFDAPGDRLNVSMQNREGDVVCFHAGLAMERRPITGASLARALVTHPFMTGKVVLGIYWQALRLWLKRTPFFSHPKHAAAAGAETTTS